MMSITLPGGLRVAYGPWRCGQRWGADHDGHAVHGYRTPITAVLALWSWKRTMHHPGAV